MEDYHVAKFVQQQGHELGLFAIYDGHLGDSVPAYLQKHLFPNILKEVGLVEMTWQCVLKFFFTGIKPYMPCHCLFISLFDNNISKICIYCK